MATEDEVRERITAMYGAMAREDTDFVTNFFATDAPVVIGTDPSEWFAGRDDVLQGVCDQLPDMAGVRIEPGALAVGSAGDVAWAVDRPAVTMADGAPGPALRISSVFVREGGTWRAVQWHASIGVDAPT